MTTQQQSSTQKTTAPRRHVNVVEPMEMEQDQMEQDQLEEGERKPDAQIDTSATSEQSAPNAVPVPLTAAQIAAVDFLGIIQTAFVQFYGQRPIGTALPEWNEPSDDEIEARVMNYKRERGVSLMTAFAGVQTQIQAQRASYDAARVSQAPTDREWLAAALASVNILRGGLDELLVKAGGKVTRNTSTRSNIRSSAIDTTRVRDTTPNRAPAWAKKAPQILAYVRQHGLQELVLVDRTKGGYTDVGGQQYHAIRLLDDGQWERLSFNEADRSWIGTGDYVNHWKYFNAPNGQAPKHQLDEMYVVLLPNGFVPNDQITPEKQDGWYATASVIVKAAGV